MIEAATLAPMKDLAARFAAFRDVDAVCALLFMRGRKPNEVARELARTGVKGGEADRLAERLADPREAWRYVRRLAETFAPFAEILRGLNITADGHEWVRVGARYVQMKHAAARRKRAELMKNRKNWNDWMLKKRRADEKKKATAARKRSARDVRPPPGAPPGAACQSRPRRDVREEPAAGRDDLRGPRS